MRQIWAILWDSYRLLTAKKLFWVIMGLSVFIALVYASISFGDRGISILFGAFSFGADWLSFDDHTAEYLYLSIYTDLLVPFWLGLIAIVLALISVCSVFPNFLASGSVDVAISKPVSRVTLFFVKYFGNLLFVAVQVGVFCLIVFIAHGIRMEYWNFGIFWAVPLLTFVFSLIYCVAVLTAVWTRSTLLSLLMAFLMWGVSWGVQMGESLLYKFIYTYPVIQSVEGVTTDQDESDSGLVEIHRIVSAVETPFPKTREVTYMLKRKIAIDGEKMAGNEKLLGDEASQSDRRTAKAVDDYATRHSESYIIGSSLIFETCILALACCIFVRKDY